MVLLGDEAQEKALFGPFGDSVNLDARLEHGLRRTYHRHGNRFGCTRWNSLVTWVLWNLISVRLEIVLVSMQDMCTICVECTIGSKIVLDTTYGTAR
jgi:hypothetical protein